MLAYGVEGGGEGAGGVVGTDQAGGDGGLDSLVQLGDGRLVDAHLGLPSAVRLDTGGTIWTDVSPNYSPSGRWTSAAAFDSARDTVVLFGGAQGGYVSGMDVTYLDDEEIAAGKGPAGRIGAVTNAARKLDLARDR